MAMGLTIVTPAASLPVSLSDLAPELASYSQSVANDAVLTQKLYEAVAWLESKTCRCFIQSTWKQSFDNWPRFSLLGCNEFKINLQPLSSISSVKYYDVNGAQQTVVASNYWVDTSSLPPRIVFKNSFAWPTVEIGRPSAVEVVFVAGYENAATVPYIAKLAIKKLAAYWYEKPEAATVADSTSPNATSPTFGEIPFGVYTAVADLNASGYT